MKLLGQNLRTALALLFVVAAPALAQTAPGRLSHAEVRARIDEVAKRLEGTDAGLQRIQREYTARPAPTDDEVLRARFAEGEIQFVSGAYAEAALLFYDLVSTDAFKKHRRYPDALSLLAEALYQQGNYLGARLYLRELMTLSSEHRPRALARYVETSGKLNEFSGIDGLVEQARDARGALPPEIAYVYGKWLFSRGDLQRAKRLSRAEAVFTPLAQGNGPHRLQSAFFLALIEVERGQLQTAAERFDALLLEVASSEPERAVKQTAALALGRVLFDLKRFDEASAVYAQVPEGSPHQDEALFENAWARLKAGDAARAHELLDRLLLVAPDSPLAPRAQLLRGHLLLQLERFDDAEATYEGVLHRYLPVYDEISGVVAVHSDPTRYFAEQVKRHGPESRFEDLLPPIALKWAKEEEQVTTAVRMLEDLKETEQAAREAQQAAAGVVEAIDERKLEIFPEVQDGYARTEALANALTYEHAQLARLAGLLAQDALTSAERTELERLQREQVPLELRFNLLPRSDEAVLERRLRLRAKVDALDREAAKLSTELKGLEALREAELQWLASNAPAVGGRPGHFGLLPALQLEGDALALLRTELDAVRQELLVERASADATLEGEAEIRRRFEANVTKQLALVTGASSRLTPQAKDVLLRAEAIRGRVFALRDRVDTARKVLTWQLENSGKNFRDRAATERKQLAAHLAQLETLNAQTRALVGQVTFESFEHVRARFASLIREAELGLLDVAFTRKQRRTDAIQALSDRKQRDLEAFDEEFRDVRGEPSVRAEQGRSPNPSHFTELSDAYDDYATESEAYAAEIDRFVDEQYQGKRGALAQGYERALRDLENLERKDRNDAIARFERFIERHPDDPERTPDIMFRLAELLYERSSDDHLVALRKHEKALEAFAAEAEVTLRQDQRERETPAEPRVDHSPSIAIYRVLLEKFPTYELNDASLYLLGYCEEREGRFDRAQASYRALIRRYPRSRFVAEAWVRIGEHHFDSYSDPDSLDKAADAYRSALTRPDHPLYDKALYKLGWTHYRADRFDEAVERFVQLADFYEARSRGEAGGDLYNEALQYTAVSFADETWGSLEKAKAYFARLGGRRYEGDLFRRLGNVLFDQTRHDDAIAALRHSLQRDPLQREAPRILQKIVQAFERDQKQEEAYREAEKIADLLEDDSPWRKRWHDEPEALSTARRIAEKSLYTAAVFRHQQALRYKKDGRLEQAKAGFEGAARAYRAYLRRFPDQRGAYDVEFYLAECLYNSQHYREAGKHYANVRGSSLEVKFLPEAAFSAVLAFKKHLDEELAAGRLKERKPRKAVELTLSSPFAVRTVEAPTLTESELEFIQASDAFASELPADPRAPAIAYKAAELLYASEAFEEARPRLQNVIARWPKTEVARFAANWLIETHLIDGNWTQVEEAAAKLAQNAELAPQGSELRTQLLRFKLAGRFKRAEQLLAAGQFEAAAQKFLAVVSEDPKHEFADESLNNAAVAFESARRFESALRLYERIFREYPGSTLADVALFRVAVNAENAYDFERAVGSYQRLVKEYPKAKDHASALYNLGRLLEGLQRYPEAAKAFLEYARRYPEADDAARLQLRASRILEKERDHRGQIRALDELVTRFASRPAVAELVVEAYHRQGKAWLELGQSTRARASFERACASFEEQKLTPETHPLAAEAAARSRFELAELELRAFDAMKIGGRGKALEQSFQAKRDAVKRVNEAYAQVYPYKRLEWTLAALFRRGHALERFATTIIETPVPADVKRLGEDAVIAYQDLLAQQTLALENAAIESYVATLDEAREHRLVNRWTQLTLEALNRFRPKEYPVLKEPLHAYGGELPYSDALLESLDRRTEVRSPSKLTDGVEK